MGSNLEIGKEFSSLPSTIHQHHPDDFVVYSAVRYIVLSNF